MRITERIRLDFEQRAEAFDLAADRDPEELAYMAVFYRDLAQDLHEALGAILDNEMPDYKAAEEFGGYVLDDALRKKAIRALRKARGED